MINLWNSLLQDVEIDTSLDGFKEGVDNLMEGSSVNGYDAWMEPAWPETVHLQIQVTGPGWWEQQRKRATVFVPYL